MKVITYGTPFATDAVVRPCPVGDQLQHFTYTETDILRIFSCPLGDKAIVYGLGETMRGINKRGGRYVSYNTDTANHQENTPSLYGSHNFLIVDDPDSGCFGAFFDTPSRVTFEVDWKGSGALTVSCEGQGLRLYLLEGETAAEITHEFREAIGRSYIPPLWAFGFGQSRWGYKTEKDFDDVVSGYRNHHIPLDWICMDIDYMDRFIDFTVHPKRFPDLKAYADKLRQEGVRLVPIIDAGIKIEPGNETYDVGAANGYFCLNHEGKPFQAAVWPGLTHFPDFFQPEARAWFGSRYQVLTDKGIEGFWNDMNEPSIFYSEYNPKGAIGRLKDLIHPQEAETGENSTYQDYKNFYHRIDGELVLHHEVHNLYGALMTRASGEGLEQLLPGRYLLFSRSSYIGAHRYGGIWTGDNSSSWALLKQNLYHMPGLNMCGFLYTGADTGGFGGNADRELLLRWLALSAFTPLMRNHTALGTRRQECYQFGDTQAFANVISLRYRLLPYLYSEFMKAALNGEMYMQPLGFVWPQDENARACEDQLLVGQCVMIAPILEQGALTRKVYLPTPMTEVRWDGARFRTRAAAQGWRDITVPLDEVVFFLRDGAAIPVGGPAQCTDQVSLEQVQLLGPGSTYQQYLDDGQTREYGPDHIRTLTRA